MVKPEPIPEQPDRQSPDLPTKITSVEPFKFVGSLICAQKDAEGRIVGEVEAAKIVLYAHEFGVLEVKVAEVMAKVG